MSVKQNFRKLLLVSTSCAFFAACADTSVSSPGATNIGTPPGGGGGTGGGGSQTTIDLVPAGGCGTGSVREATVVNGDVTINACEITGNITQDTVIAQNAGVLVTGPTFVGSDGGVQVTLEIGAGATLFGSAGSDYIVVARGSRIEANGTSAAPIVMTSRQDVEGTVGENDRGQWGGLIINGFAPINACIDGTAVGGSADCEKSGEGSSGLFGGDNPADDSGWLRYVQVRYAGFLINNEDELNGIAFQGVGSGTDVHHIQVHNNADDGIEMFGGAVDVRNVVLTGNADDSFDYTDGWVGRAQYVLVRQSGDDADQGFEFDNRSSNNDLTPRSNPRIANFTIIGERGAAESDDGILLRAGTAAELYNGIVVDMGEECLDIDNDATFDGITGANGRPADEDIIIQSVFFNCPTNFKDDGADDLVDIADFVTNTMINNVDASSNSMSGVLPGPQELAVVATDVNAIDPWFDATSYAGAFSGADTTASNWAAGWTFGLFEDPGCPTGTTESAQTIDGQRVCQITGNITSDVRLTRGSIYELVGPVFVGVDRGADPASPLPSGIEASLTIDPGVTIFGTAGSDYIVVARGSQIFSNGTSAAPVIMTARSDVEGTVGANDRGQWGGLVLNGRAPINACIDGTATGGTTDCEKSGEGSSGLFGGATPTDDSGDIFYTQVRYAGFLINNEDELNGIAFQGIGSGTDVDYIQVHNNADDGIEMFGGAVDVRHVVLTGNADDSFDYTDGWVGRAQYVIVAQSGDDADQGFEFDNRSSNNDLTPRSNPRISNFTIIGERGAAESDDGILLRAGSAGEFYNGIVVDMGEECLDIDNDATFDGITGANGRPADEDIIFQSIYFSCPTNFKDDGADDLVDVEDFILNTMVNNVSDTDGSTMSGFAFIPGNTGVVPGAEEQAVVATDINAIDAWFEDAQYAGAVEDANDTWFQGWTYVRTQ
ncbi:MAG: hypothetical protein JJ884_00285 [Maricaulis sp.]|uniref:hypothetical protein n=1 Tax=Maricaulis sp. TaxID=1486257 RepID=UPI001AFFCA04|nr:hypothetical protein [Maricaulis sp.]MBO6845931.1 hypothetical protein [Maricaulis sp.]MBO6876193.1 hypothetical protein [Maricaulis sp.]